MTHATPFHVHALRGCTPRPLASYLKALGVLRVVAEQADPAARGLWRDETFTLVTRLDEAALLGFFLHAYRPSPFPSPWNKGSGLLADDPKGVGPVLASTAPRFADARQGLQAAKALTAEMEAAVAAEKALKSETNRIKDPVAKAALRESPEYKQGLALAARACKRLKDELQPECQRRWRGPALRWLRAAVVLGAEGDAVFPSLLGTGGNDGKLDFTNNALQRLGTLFDLGSVDGAPRPGAEAQLRAALLGDTTQGLVRGAIGQFAPAASGGANATSAALGDSLLNPWDLPLLLEGALLFTAGTSRRLGGAASERTVAPFSTRPWAVGYGSASGADESARGEQWMPLWDRPWTVGEVAALLAEGRSQTGSRPCESSMDMARAVARLGVARGVTAFERYGYIERNGKSNYAVPLGRWAVRAEPRAELVDDLEADGWWSRLRRAATDAKAPASVALAERRLGDAVMAALGHGGEPARWQAVLLALAEVEARLVTSGAYTVEKRLGPIPRLRPAWVAALDDGGPEVRLALALAGAGAAHDGRGRPVDPARGHWLPLDRFGRFATREGQLAHDPHVVVSGRDAEADLIRVVQRRLTDAGAGAARTLPLCARPGTAADLGDVAALLRGGVDLERTVWLARGLAALDWAAWEPARHRLTRPASRAPVDLGWAALRLCHLPGPLPDGARVPADPTLVRSFAAGDAPRAFARALHRLRGAGIAAPFIAATVPEGLARRMAASLAFPISPRAAAHLARELDPARAAAAQEEPHG